MNHVSAREPFGPSRGTRSPSERALLRTASEPGEQPVDRGDGLVAGCSGFLRVGDVEGCLVGGRE